jgi:hypothetical protein
MAIAQTFMVFILVVSFGVLAAVFLFWLQSGKLVEDNLKNTQKNSKEESDTLDFAQWQTTLLMR